MAASVFSQHSHQDQGLNGDGGQNQSYEQENSVSNIPRWHQTPHQKEKNSQFIPLVDYSIKYKVSLSTLRRRIRSESISFRKEQGRYLLPDQPLDGVVSPSPEAATLRIPVMEAPVAARSPALVSSIVAGSSSGSTVGKGDSVLATANRLLTELKKAYSQIVLDKDDQILLLKNEVSDLKTLVRILESENERLASQSNLHKPLTL